jgi:hypothetical protein
MQKTFLIGDRGNQQGVAVGSKHRVKSRMAVTINLGEWGRGKSRQRHQLNILHIQKMGEMW